MAYSHFESAWKQYEHFIQAIVKLLHPFAEVAIHDLEKGEIAAIYNNISRRQIHDPSPLKELKVRIQDLPDYFDPYYKQNWNGHPLKCTSITLRNARLEPVGLICINIDVNHFSQGYRLLEAFLKTKKESENPIEVFGGPFEGQISHFIQNFLEELQLPLHRLNRAQKKELVQFLYRKGVFNFKNATNFTSKKLNTSRASIYNYIKQIES
ncbi:MAG: PAS domain-containing protein [Chlamydiales bacterium]|nr:PAS domain-containing protein [Chlamydiales bacterium]